ncbi:MFS transporter [aff. Roholtiella sp. LEGE 12411]|uniref:MFS transporter n=1 Tax=aff. Roholtiella sp. LEGE 12411 TaxID=1828822 RepID=UPI00187ED7BE|nr:MFS transporter [aff. Roholtiella sp. LEGE 12411]MBE9034178.1 MFS transporter [aff. Roholtiella sp. LEGE 12411]
MKRNTIWVMAITAGIAVANLYYNQPLLAEMGRSFHASAQQVGFIPMLTQIGYALGILLFVPLGDLLERRKLIATMLVATACALVTAAVSPSLVWLAGASLAIGITTIVPQLILPFAAHLAKPTERGKVVGNVMSALFIGILLARTVSGWIGETLGWRAMYWIAGGLTTILAVAILKLLPKSQPSLELSYQKLIQSLLGLIRSQPVLREASIIGFLSFGAFSAFWSTLAFLLEQPPYHYGSRAAGMFGLVGIVGSATAPVIGRFADHNSPRLTVGLGVSITALAFVVFWFFGHQMWGLVSGVILLDLGAQSTLVSNQARIYSLLPEAQSRLNTVYMVSNFMGGSLGSILGVYGWSWFQWNGVCLVGFSMLVASFAIFCGGYKRSVSAPSQE